MLILASCSMIWAASSEEESAEDASKSAGGSEEQDDKAGKEQKQHHQGVRLVSFDTVDRDISIGLDYLLPFIKVPVKRKRYGPPRVRRQTPKKTLLQPC